MTFNEKILEGLDEILSAVKSVRQLIQDGGIPENEDWIKAAAPMHQIVNLLTNYRNYKDQEMAEGKNFFVGSDGMLIPISRGQSEELSAMKEGRELIGYQIMDDDCEFPEELFSFMVFKKEDDAYAYIQAKGLQGFNVIEQYEGDVEDPTFVGIRIFKEGERVFNCESNPHESDLRDWATVCHDFVEIYADQVVLVKMDDGSENETESGNLYQIAEDKVCPRCGNPLCIEHNDEIDYPYFCPDCDENFYGIEVQ